MCWWCLFGEVGERAKVDAWIDTNGLSETETKPLADMNHEILIS